MDQIEQERYALIEIFKANDIDCPHKVNAYFQDNPPKNNGEYLVFELNNYYLATEGMDYYEIRRKGIEKNSKITIE